MPVNGVEVQVDQDVCQATSLCTMIAPKVFELVDGNIVVRSEEVDEADLETLTDAERTCPTQAISVANLRAS